MLLLNDAESTVYDKPIGKIQRNWNKNNLSVNVRNGADWLKKLLGEALLSFKIKKGMSSMNMDKL